MRIGKEKVRKINLLSSYGTQSMDYIVYIRIAFTAIAVLIIVFTLILTIYLHYKKNTYAKEAADLEMLIVELIAENEIAKELAVERDEKNRMLSEFQADHEAAKKISVFTKADLNNVLDSLGRVEITGISFSNDASQFMLNCRADTIDEPYYFAKRLKDQNVFADVSYGGFSVSLSNVVTFNVTCVLREGEE